MIWDILSFPFKLVGNIVGWALSLTGHILGFILGLVLLVVGIALCLTIIGLIVGIPLAIVGAGMMLKSLFEAGRASGRQTPLAGRAARAFARPRPDGLEEGEA